MKSADVEALIQQVSAKQAMDESSLQEFITGVADRNIEISLIEKWLKAVHSNGISVPETTQLTKGMMLSGSVINWHDNSLVVDKHSTGELVTKCHSC